MKDILVAMAARPQDVHFDGEAGMTSTPTIPMAALSRAWLILSELEGLYVGHDGGGENELKRCAASGV